MQEHRQARVGVDDLHVHADARDAEGSLDDHLVQKCRAGFELHFRVTALPEHVERVSMGEDLVGDEQHTDAPGQGGQELVQATIRGRDSQSNRCGAKCCGPGQRQLPESDRSFFGLGFDDRRRP